MAPQTINLPYLDAAEVYGLDSSQPQTIDLPFLEVGAVFAPTFSQDATTGLAVLVNGVEVEGTSVRSFEEQLAATGSFSFQMLRPDFAAAGIDFDDLVTFRLDGTARFLGVVEALDHVPLAQGEAADQTVTVKGRGSLAEWDKRRVLSSRPVGSLPIEEVRTFSVVGPDFDISSIPLAKRVNRQRDYASWKSPVPHVYPDTEGWWIAPNLGSFTALNAPAGAFWAFKDFTLASDAELRIFGAGDNSIIGYFDGAKIIDSRSFYTAKFVELEASAGDHRLAVQGVNYATPPTLNPAGIIMAGYTIGAGGLLDDLVFSTDYDWQAIYVGSGDPPGFTHGQVIRTIYEESDLASDGWILDFTDLTDSAGQPWTARREITVSVYRSALQTLFEMADTDIDIHAAPGGRILRAYNRGGRGVVRSVTLQQTADKDTSDFLELSHAGKRTRVNRYYIRYGNGTTVYEDAASIAAEGLCEDYLELGAVQTESAALTTAAALMENRAAPAYSTSATLQPRSDATTPYKSWEVSDWITAPDELDDDVLMRAVSIEMKEDGEGVITWPVRLRDQQLDAEERHDVWLRRMADGAALGGARVSSRAGEPLQADQNVAVLKVAEFSYDNTQIETGPWPKRPADQSGNIVEVFGELTTAGSTTTTVVAYLDNGSVSTLATLTFAAGETETEEPVAVVPVRANRDKVWIDCTAAGTDAEGLVVQVRAI